MQSMSGTMRLQQWDEVPDCANDSRNETWNGETWHHFDRVDCIQYPKGDGDRKNQQKNMNADFGLSCIGLLHDKTQS